MNVDLIALAVLLCILIPKHFLFSIELFNENRKFDSICIMLSTAILIVLLSLTIKVI